MNKGLIMELKKDYAIVLNDDGSMEKILIKPQMSVGQKIFYFEEDIIKTSTGSNFKYNLFMKSFGTIAALFLIVFTFFYNFNFNKTYAVVSLDINPSIQIEVDNNQKIINVKGMNDDGKNIDFTGVKGCNINDGIKTIKEILVEKEYLKTNKDVLVGFAFVKNGDETNYEDSIKDAVLSNFDTENVTYLKAQNKDDVVQAKEQGISLGRYEASKVVSEETKKKIVNAPVKEITDQIKDKENVIYYNAEDEKAEDVSNPKEENKNNIIQKDKASDSNVNINPSTNTNTDKKEQSSVTSQKPDIGTPADDNVPSQTDKEENSTSKSEINDGILELEPEKIDKDKNSNNNQQSENENTILEPDKDVIENSTTSGKIEEDDSQEIVPDAGVEEPVEDKIK